MLKIRYGLQWQENSDVTIQEICANAKKGLTGQILIVPEQFSFDAEWRLCSAGGDGISQSAEVLSFTRLANRVFSLTGGIAGDYMDKSGKLIAMAGALEQVRSRLKIYGKHIAKPEFLLQLIEISDEFKSYGVDSAAIHQIWGELSGTLAVKMEELRLILESYDAVCVGARQDPATRFDRLQSALLDSDYAQNRQIYIDGFSDFTLQEQRIVEALALTAENVTVCLCCDGLSKGQSVFGVPRDTAAALLSFAARHDLPVHTQSVAPKTTDTPLAHLRQNLFSSRPQPWGEKTDALRLCAAPEIYEECLALVGQIQRLLLAGGRYRDICVAYTERSTYAPVLENLLARYEIPGYFAGSQDVLRQPVARMVLSALEAAACGMEAEPVAEYLKSGLSPLCRDMCDRLENYAYTWNIHGTIWEKAFTLHPEGYGAKATERSEDLLRQLNDARSVAICPVIRLKNALLAAKNTGQQVLALNQFLEDIALEQSLEQRADSLIAAGDYQRAQEYSQLYDILTATMEQTYGVLGQTVRTPEEFFRFFKAALSQCNVGTIPASLDCVHVGDIASMRNVRPKHLLVVGAAEGLFPGYTPGKGLLSDGERKLLKEVGLPVAPNGAERIDRELLSAYLVLTAACDSLYLSYAGEEPSYLFTRIKRLFPYTEMQETAALPANKTQAAGQLAALQEESRCEAISALPELAAAVDGFSHRADYRPGVLTEKTVERLYGKEIHLSASKIDKFASCKYAYFLSYGLKAVQRKQAAVDAPMFGTFVHEVLEKTSKQVVKEGGFHVVSCQRLMELAQQYIQEFISQQLNGLADKPERTIYLFRRSLEEVLGVVRELWEELRLSDFVPEGFELEFSHENAITVQGKLASCRITGFVDRTDLYRDPAGNTYFRVVDYKTGKKEFDYTDILSGIGLQMLIYLFVLEQRGKGYFGTRIRPAGVLYFPARMDVLTKTEKLSPEAAEKARQKEFSRKGLLLDDETVLQAMEHSQGSPVYLPYKVNKDGERKGDLASREQLERLKRHVFRTLADMTDEICSGKVAPNPYARGEEHSACRWCEYRAVCHVDSGEIEVRNLEKTNAERFWAELERKEREHG